MIRPSRGRVDWLSAALLSARYSYTSGRTHNFYHYPARFSPDIARAVIEIFSEPGNWVMDPFMGGGTAIIEGLTLGRRMIGIDVNTLAHFVAKVRTTPLSTREELLLRAWAARSAAIFGGPKPDLVEGPKIKNLPGAIKTFISGALEQSRKLPLARQRALARCALLRLGQWALDCRDSSAPRRHQLGQKLPQLTEEMLVGLREFAESCRQGGLQKREIVRSRMLLHRSAVGLDEDARIRMQTLPPRLIFTSPPYPSVHVLYHRWQYRGRKETAAPYWIANVADGYHGSYYMGGSRTPTGRKRYFDMITAAFKSVRAVIDQNGLVVQLIGFSDIATQLPQYLEAMEDAGFEEWTLPYGEQTRLGRRVPNRKWYAKLQGAVDASSELLLFHRPRRLRART